MFVRSINRRRDNVAFRATIALFTIALSIALSGCDKTDDSINGTYEHVIRTPGDGVGHITLVLSRSNRAVFTVQPPGESALPSTEGTYTVRDNILTVTINDGVTVYTLRGSKLEGEFLDQPIWLKKK